MMEDVVTYQLGLEAPMPSGHRVQFVYDQRAGQVIVGWLPALPDDLKAYRKNAEWWGAFCEARDHFLGIIADAYCLDITIADPAGNIENVIRPTGALLH